MCYPELVNLEVNPGVVLAASCLDPPRWRWLLNSAARVCVSLQPVGGCPAVCALLLLITQQLAALHHCHRAMEGAWQ
jgi:hypothetical protein